MPGIMTVSSFMVTFKYFPPQLMQEQVQVLLENRFLLFIAFGLLVLLAAGLIGLLSRKPEAFPYVRQPALFTPAERVFYQALTRCLDENYLVFGKVRLADIIRPGEKLNNSEHWKAFNRISAKHLDFVICHRDDLSVAACVELDDKSHRLPHRRARDAFVDAAMSAAGVALLHVPVQRQYALPELKQALEKVLVKPDKKQ